MYFGIGTQRAADNGSREVHCLQKVQVFGTVRSRVAGYVLQKSKPVGCAYWAAQGIADARIKRGMYEGLVCINPVAQEMVESRHLGWVEGSWSAGRLRCVA